MMINENNVKEYVEKIKLWIKETMDKANSKGVVLGMSGGIDCSVVARLFQEANIPIILVMMPYGESMNLAGDNKDAKDLIEKFNFEYMTIDITNTVNTLVNSMAINTYDISNPTAHTLIGVTGKLGGRKIPLSSMGINNIKPRVRMTTLYTLAQSLNYLVAGTGNLSEKMLGYFTKWGDSGNDINPIGNLTKTEVRILAKELDIPKPIINKAPSANLWKGQTDEEEMGVTYEEIDKFINGEDISEEHKNIIENQIKKTNHKRMSIPTFEK